MQRFFEVRRDQYGNPASGLSCSVYLSGTGLGTLATIFAANDSSDTPATATSNPIVTGADGIVSFAVADGDYDLVFVGADGATEYRYRQNLFDSTTATTIPVSQISLTMPSVFTVTGSPGTSISVVLATQAANLLFAGPTSGAAAAPTFRSAVAADVSSIACLLTTNQSIGGNKGFTGDVVIGGDFGVVGAATFATTVGVSGVLTAGANLVMEKTSKVQIDTATPDYPYKTVQASDIGYALGAGSTPVATTFQGTIKLWLYEAATIESRMLTFDLPYDYEAGTDIYFYATWSSDGTDTGKARLGWEYCIVKAFDQGPFPGPTTVTVETNAEGTQYQAMTSVSAAIDGTNFEPGTAVSARFYREGNHGNDTLTDGIFMHSVGVMYQASRLGTKNSVPPFFT